MVKIALDAGHGRHTSGKRTPDGESEWTFNDKVLRACVAKLNEYQNVEVLRLDDPTGEADVPLKARTDRANIWKADVLVSSTIMQMQENGAVMGAWKHMYSLPLPQWLGILQVAFIHGSYKLWDCVIVVLKQQTSTC